MAATLLDTHSRRRDAFRRGQRTRGREAGIGGHPGLGQASQGGQVGLGRLGVTGPGHHAGDPLGQDPVDHAETCSRRCSVSGVRAATTGELGVASSGAPSGSSKAGKLTSPPASRTISCAAAASTPRERAGTPCRRSARRRPGTARRQSCPGRGSGSSTSTDHRPRRPAIAGRRTRSRRTSRRPSWPRRSPSVVVEPLAVEPRALAAARPPLLAEARNHARSRTRRRPSSGRRRPRATGRGGGCRAWR